MAANLLRKAYTQIEAGNHLDARTILETLVNADPMNVEAWEAYMQMSETCEELDHLCDRVLQVSELTRTERESILDYYYFLRQRIKACGTEVEAQEMITFELVDQFTYTLRERPSSNPTDAAVDRIHEHGIARILRKMVIIPYGVLLAVGLNLLSAGNNFGYWIILVLSITIFVSLWNIIFPAIKIDQRPRTYQAESMDMQEDAVRGQPKVVL